MSLRVHMSDTESLRHRVALSFLVFLQVTLVPIFGFSATYLLKIDRGAFSVSVRTELIEWIIIAGLLYGIFSLSLALLLGGYKPLSVVKRGGWLPVLGLSRRKGDPELVDLSRISLYSSPYGRMTRLVDKKVRSEGIDLISVHGGLQLIAVPIQVLLIAIPLAIMEGVPESVMRPERAFELGMAGYLVSLWLAVRMQPFISQHLVVFAAMFRTVIWRVSRFSWILPILIFWFTARFLLEASLDWLEVDFSKWNEIHIESLVLDRIAPDAEVPPKAIIDFLIAISVLPLATFTSISVLGGSNGIPKWMLSTEDRMENLQMGLLEAPDEEVPTLDDLGVGGILHEDEGEGDDDGGMIDIPFELFDGN